MSLELKKINSEIGKNVGLIVFFSICVGAAITYLTFISRPQGSIILILGATTVWLTVLIYLSILTKKQISLRRSINVKDGKYQDH